MPESRQIVGSVARILLCALLLGWSSPALPAQPHFVRGDVDDSGRLEVTDAVKVLRYLFLSDETAILCEDAADIDDNGSVVITDAIYLLQHLFNGASAPPYPFPHCGIDITVDVLTCAQYSSCSPTFDFYGAQYVGGGVSFVVDRSGSMMDSGELQIAKREIVSAIESLPEDAEFGIVFFDAAISKFPSSDAPARATSQNKAEAIAWVQEVTFGGGSCIRSGLLQGLEYARSSTARRRVLIYVGDGGGTCGGIESEYLADTVESVTRENAGQTPVHCVGVLMEGRTLQESYLRQLAVRNGGAYRRVN